MFVFLVFLYCIFLRLAVEELLAQVTAKVIGLPLIFRVGCGRHRGEKSAA
jgi:hypothetical protein